MYQATLITALVGIATLPRASAAPTWGAWPSYKHVITISVDGMHGSDVEKYLAVRPKSTIASLLGTGIEYQNCYTSAPSDSFPGTMAQYTGGSPRTHGIWYDDLWDWTYYPAGSNCTTPAGAEVAYDESIDFNSSLVFSGGIDPANLPMTFINHVCTPVYPHMRLLTNTVFNILNASGLQTAYTDKHPAYDIVNGPSGKGLTTGYFPEIAAFANTVNATIKYDSLHVQAWLDWIDGVTPPNSTYGHLTPGQMPPLMGGNFQSINVAQKTVGYNADGSLSTALLQAFDFVDASLGKITKKLNETGKLADTLLIVASKHGQAPINPKLLRKIAPDTLKSAIGVPTAFVTTDDVALVWLNNTADIPRAAANLKANATNLGIQEVIFGDQLIAQGFGDPLKSPRVPHIIVKVNPGVIYTTSKSKVAEHGGLGDDDRHVACFVSNPDLQKRVVTDHVETKQVAPSLLQALGISGSALQAAVQEGTQVLPHLFHP